MSHYIGTDLEQSLPEFRPNTSITRLLVDAFSRNGNSTGIVEGQTGKSATFKEILQQSLTVAATLSSEGLVAGDYVIICCDKSIKAYTMVFGALFAGATVLLPQLNHANILHKIIRGHIIKLVICDPVYHDTLAQSLCHLTSPPPIYLTTDNCWLTPAEDFQVYEAQDIRKHISIIFFSSGTTGEPKGIQLTDIAVQLCGKNFQHKFTRFLIESPLYWISAFFPVISSIFNNFTIVLNNLSEPSENLKLIEKFNIDAWFSFPGSMYRYINEPALKTFDLSSVTHTAVAGEYVLGSVTERFMKNVFGGKMNLEIIYGITEVGFVSVFNTEQNDDRARTGECGKIYPGLEIKILDDEGNIVPLGTVGSVWIKSVSVTPGYWGRPDLNKDAFDKDGFFNSGDAAFFDKDFNLFHRGRMSDLINYKGTKVAPGETEDVLMAHEDVLDGAVVGTPHPTDIQHLTAFVELRPGATATAQEIADFVNGRVEDKRRLRGGVNILNKLPRTVVGKILRIQLRQHKSIKLDV